MSNLPWDLVMPWVDPICLISVNHAYRRAHYAPAVQSLDRSAQRRLGRALVRADANWCLATLVTCLVADWRAPVLRLFKGIRYPDYIELLRAYSLQCGSMRSRQALSAPLVPGTPTKRPKRARRSERRWTG